MNISEIESDSENESGSEVNYSNNHYLDLDIEEEVKDISNNILLVNNLYTNKKTLEYELDRIKILSKGYFSEFKIIAEFVIPEKINNFEIIDIINLVKDKYDNINPDNIEKLLNKYMINKDKVIVYKEKELLSFKVKELLTHFLRIRTIKSIGSGLQISSLLEEFKKFLKINYPGYSYIYNNKNFTPLLKELGYSTHRKNDGIYCLDLKLK